MEYDGYYPVYWDLYVASRMYLVEDEASKMLAFGKVTINNLLVIDPVRVMKGKADKQFLSFPQYRMQNGKYGSYVSFKSPEIFDRIQEQIFWNVAYLLEAKNENSMKVSVKKIGKGNLLATASVEMAGVIIHQIRVVRWQGEGGEKRGVIMPQYQGKDVIYPANAEIRAAIKKAVLEEYDRIITG